MLLGLSQICKANEKSFHWLFFAALGIKNKRRKRKRKEESLPERESDQGESRPNSEMRKPTPIKKRNKYLGPV